MQLVHDLAVRPEQHRAEATLSPPVDGAPPSNRSSRPFIHEPAARRPTARRAQPARAPIGASRCSRAFARAHSHVPIATLPGASPERRATIAALLSVTDCGSGRVVTESPTETRSRIGPEMAPSGPETAPRMGISGYFLVVRNRPFAGLFQIRTYPGSGIIIRRSQVRVPSPASRANGPRSAERLPPGVASCTGGHPCHWRCGRPSRSPPRSSGWRTGSPATPRSVGAAFTGTRRVPGRGPPRTTYSVPPGGLLPRDRGARGIRLRLAPARSRVEPQCRYSAAMAPQSAPARSCPRTTATMPCIRRIKIASGGRWIG